MKLSIAIFYATLKHKQPGLITVYILIENGVNNCIRSAQLLGTSLIDLHATTFWIHALTFPLILLA